jgi:hypothetical protein
LRAFQIVAIVVRDLAKALSSALQKGYPFDIRISGRHSKLTKFDITIDEKGGQKHEDLRDECLRIRTKKPR